MSAATLVEQVPPGATEDGPSVAAPAPAPAARFAALLAVLAVVVGGLALPGGPLVSRVGFASLVSGPLEVDEGAGWRPVAVGETVGPAVHLRASGGRASLDAGGARIVLAGGTHARTEDDQLALERGSALIDGAAVRTVVVDGVEARGRGTWRVDAGAQPRVATYRGEVEVTDGGTTVALTRFRQVAVRDRAVGGSAVVPLRYVATDGFDREQLAEAFRVDDLAQALSSSLTSTYGQTGQDAAFYAAFTGGAHTGELLSRFAPDAAGDRFAPPAEVLVALSVLDAVAELTGAPEHEAGERVASLRERGAAWGLIVVVAGGDAAAFGRAADRVLERAAGDPPPTTEPSTTEPRIGDGAPNVADAAGTPTAPTAPGTGAGSGADPGTGTGAGTGTPGGGGGGDDPAGPTAPLPSAPDPGDGTDGLEDGIADLGDALTDLVDGALGGGRDRAGPIDGLLGSSPLGSPGG